MDSLVDFSSVGSSTPWLWIIEYLASLKEVDTSILHDLIEMAPELPDDLAKSTREMVALRCLEDLFGPSDKVYDDGLFATEKKVGFALSESCEDVLQHILQETSASDLKMAGPELLKWDVHPFLMHKRALMPKCALQELKDTILEGTHPLAASLKESSGLICLNECDRAHVADLDRNVLVMSEKENLVPSSSENRDGLSGDNFHNRHLLPSKRDRNNMAAGEMAGHTIEVQEGSDFDYNAKKLKPDAISNKQLVDEISVPHCDKETVEYPSGRVVAVAGEDGCIANQSQDEGMKGSQFPEDGSDKCGDLRRLGENGDANDDQIQHNQAVDGQNAGKMPQDKPVQNAGKMPQDKPVQNAYEANYSEPRTSTGAPSEGIQLKDIVDDSKGEMEHSHGEEMSSDNDEYHNERIDVSTKKSHFLSSDFSLGYDSLATSHWTEQNLCVKCNRDGQLLVCSTGSCPLVVHENCLGFPVKFDEKGNFHCPFCAYSLAISDFLEAKKKASLARKELAAFVQMGFEGHPKDLADRLQSKDPNHSRSNGDEDIHENGHLGGQENQNGQCLRDVNDPVCQKVRGSKKQSEPFASCVNGNSPCREEEAKVFDGRVFVFNGDKVMEENMVKEFSSETGLDGDQDQAPPDPKSDCDKRTCTNIDDVPADHTDAKGKIRREDLWQASVDPSEKPVFALNIDGEETSEGENDKFIISNYQIRFRRRETHYTYPAIPHLRRKKVLWTAKEEEMLKKGVRKFASADERNIPWKKILEFGSSVFLSGRTTIDLKDKWRNMCKGSPRSK